MMHTRPEDLKCATRLDVLDWYAVRMVAPSNGHRRTAMLGGERRVIKRRSGHQVASRVPGTGERVFVSEHILRKAGFAVFLPVKKVWRKKHRFTSEQELVAFPLVADWLFVGWPKGKPRWHDLMSLHVVTGVLGSGGRPVGVSGATINKMMQLWGDGIPPAVRRMTAQANVFAGDAVTVTAGPFVDFDGIVLDVDARGARVAISLFGRETPVALRLDEFSGGSGDVPAVAGVLPTGGPACLRCAAPMVLAHDLENNHHLRCGDCGAIGALHSASPARAMDVWAERLELMCTEDGLYKSS